MMYREHEAGFHATSNEFVSEDQPATFDHDTVMPNKSDQISVRDAIHGIPLSVKEALAEVVLKVVMIRHRSVDNRLPTAVESSMHKNVVKVVATPETATHITEIMIFSLNFAHQ